MEETKAKVTKFEKGVFFATPFISIYEFCFYHLIITIEKLLNVIIIAQLFTNQFSKDIFYEVIASLFTSYCLF